MRSKIRWFTEFCNSHYVSHFAAFFIVARAKISVVESCLGLYCQMHGNFFSQIKVFAISVGNMLACADGYRRGSANA
jgi:hypothetical protein